MKFPGTALLEPIKDFDGEPFQRQSKDGQEPITVKYAIRLALTASTENRAAQGQAQTDDGPKMFELYELARKVYNQDVEGNLELSTKEIATIQERASKVWGVEIYGYLYEFLEGKLTSPAFEAV